MCVHCVAYATSKQDGVLSPVLPVQVPGGYQDSLSSNTELGRAVQNACDELDNLSNLVQDLDSCTAYQCILPSHALPVHIYR